MENLEGKKQKVRLKKNSEFKPIKNFHFFLKCEFNLIKTILVEIQSLSNNDTDVIIKNALIRYSIIKTVSTFEYFFKSLAFHIGSDISIELDKVLKGEYQKNRSKALSDSFSYSNPIVVTDLYKKLLNRDIMKDAETYFDQFNNEGVEHEIYHIRKIPLLSKNLTNFYKLFKYRNRLVHENPYVEIKYSELRKMIGAVYDVMVVASFHRM